MLTGGAGNDQLTGGSGGDIFRYTDASESPIGEADVITDFGAGDVILLDGFLVGAIGFQGNDTFSGSGETEVRFDDVTKVLEIDVDGDGVTDMEIRPPQHDPCRSQRRLLRRRRRRYQRRAGAAQRPGV